jgi:hypothetical protein
MTATMSMRKMSGEMRRARGGQEGHVGHVDRMSLARLSKDSRSEMMTTTRRLTPTRHLVQEIQPTDGPHSNTPYMYNHP